MSAEHPAGEPTTPPARPRARLRAALGGLPRAFWVVWAGTLVNRMGTMAVPFMSLYLVSERGFTVVQAGTLLAAFGAGSLGSQLLGGHLSDRVGSRLTVLGGTLATAAVMSGLAFARASVAIIALIVALGLTLELYRPATQALVTDVVPAHERARAFSLLFWAANLGFAVGMSAGGLLAEAGFTGLFLVDAITGAAFGALIFALVPESSRRFQAAASGGYRAVIADRTMLAFAISVAAYYFVYFQCDSTLPLAMRASGSAPSLYGLCMALNGLIIALATPLLAPRLLRADPARVWAAGALVVGLGFGLNAFAHSAAGFLATVTIWTLGEILPAATAGAIVASRAPAGLRGRYAGLQGLAWSSGWLTSSLGGSALLSVSPRLLWGTCSVVSAAAALGALATGTRITSRSGPPSVSEV